MYAHKFEPRELGDAALPSPQIPVVYHGEVLCGTKIHETGYAVFNIPAELAEKIESGSAVVTITHTPFALQQSPAKKPKNSPWSR
jgi:hypothetical protein